MFADSCCALVFEIESAIGIDDVTDGKLSNSMFDIAVVTVSCDTVPNKNPTVLKMYLKFHLIKIKFS